VIGEMRIEIRNDSIILDGYVNAVGRESRVLPSPKGRFRETIVPKTFEKALMKGQNVDLLFNHIQERKLGSTVEGNLELREDNIGLRATATVSDPEVIEKGKKGELRGWSFGFIANKDLWEDGSDGIHKRSIEDLDLLEVSILDKVPAYSATSIEARGEESVICEQRTEEFAPKIMDNSVPNVEHNQDELGMEKRETPIDYSLYEKTVTIMKLKGR
jgi:uncharacterized protein